MGLLGLASVAEAADHINRSLSRDDKRSVGRPT